MTDLARGHSARQELRAVGRRAVGRRAVGRRAVRVSTRIALWLALWCVAALASLAYAGVDVRVHGLGADERENVYSQIRLLAYAKALDADKGQYDADEVERLFAEGEQDIRTAIQPYGWYNPVIRRTLQGTMPDWTATYEVDAGPQTTITSINVQHWSQAPALTPKPAAGAEQTPAADAAGDPGEGNPGEGSPGEGNLVDGSSADGRVDAASGTLVPEPNPGIAPDGTAQAVPLGGAPMEAELDASLKRIEKFWPLKIGNRLKHEDYESAKTRVLQTAVASGYLDAHFVRHELRVDTELNTAEITLWLESGPRYYFGPVEIQQDAGLNDTWLRRYLTIHAGDPFKSEQVMSTQFALSDLDYFTLVEVEPHKERADVEHRIPVTIRAQAKAPRLYRFGAGYGTDTGPRALVGMEFRSLNEQGHKLRLELRPSQRISTAIAEYRIPFGKVPGENIDITTQALRENIESIQESLYSIGSGYTHLRQGYQRHDYVTYTNDRYTIPSESQRTSTLLTPGVSYSFTDADDPISPHRGWFGYLDLHGGTKYALSDTDFFQGLLKLRAVLPLTPKLRLYARAEEGGTFVSGFDSLPPSQRFFAGGDDSVRGYAYRSLGPHAATGELLGGRYLTTGSLELGYDLSTRYGLALFSDAGGADDSLSVRLHQSVGIGLRYHAPFGSIAVDLAHPLDRDATPVRLHLGVRVGL